MMHSKISMQDVIERTMVTPVAIHTVVPANAPPNKRNPTHPIQHRYMHENII
jgi:hypothetical protein